EPHYMFAWQPQVPNPLAALLAVADGFIVTIDSVSMTAEAANRMRPLHYFSLPRLKAAINDKERPTLSQRLRRRRQHRHGKGKSADFIDRLADLLAIIGLVKPRNNYASFETTLQRRGIARPLEAAIAGLQPPATNVVRLERMEVASRIM